MCHAKSATVLQQLRSVSIVKYMLKVWCDHSILCCAWHLVLEMMHRLPTINVIIMMIIWYTYSCIHCQMHDFHRDCPSLEQHIVARQYLNCCQRSSNLMRFNMKHNDKEVLNGCNHLNFWLTYKLGAVGAECDSNALQKNLRIIVIKGEFTVYSIQTTYTYLLSLLSARTRRLRSLLMLFAL